MKDKNTISFLERMEMNTLEKEWTVPQSFPDLTNSKYIAIDLETCDPNLIELGPGWTRNDGFIVGVAVAAGAFVGYYPFRHQGGGNIPEEKVFEPILDRLTNRKLDPWQVDTWETMKKVAKDEARKNGNYGELRELRKIERKSFNKRRPKKTEQTTNFVKFTNDIKPIPLPQITPEPEPVKAQEPTVKIYKDGGLGTMDRPTQLTIDAYRDLKWYNK